MLAHIKISLRGRERSLSDVPVVIWLLLITALLMQFVLHTLNPKINPFARPLPLPPAISSLQLYNLADPIAASKGLMLWLQAFDNQPGISIPFRQLDYTRLMGWLDNVLVLDNRSQYPLLAAARIYSEVPDQNKKRIMLEFVYQKFLEDPDRRWPALTHAVYVAKHQLKDMPLALRFAEALAEHVAAESAPFWVKQMHIYILEDMNEIESAKVLIGGLIESGAITDDHELWFLQQRLKRLESRIVK